MLPSGGYVFDLETDRLLNKWTRDNWSELRPTVCVGTEIGSDRSDTFVFARDPARAIELLGRRLDSAAYIVAYNGREFDFRVLHKYYDDARMEAWLEKLVDPFEVIREGSVDWIKLHDLLVANGLNGKIGTGEDAVRWWNQGDEDRVIEYCVQDVKLLHDLAVTMPVIRFRSMKNGDAWWQLRWHDYVNRRVNDI